MNFDISPNVVDVLPDSFKAIGVESSTTGEYKRMYKVDEYGSVLVRLSDGSTAKVPAVRSLSQYGEGRSAETTITAEAGLRVRHGGSDSYATKIVHRTTGYEPGTTKGSNQYKGAKPPSKFEWWRDPEGWDGYDILCRARMIIPYRGIHVQRLSRGYRLTVMGDARGMVIEYIPNEMVPSIIKDDMDAMDSIVARHLSTLQSGSDYVCVADHPDSRMYARSWGRIIQSVNKQTVKTGE